MLYDKPAIWQSQWEEVNYFSERGKNDSGFHVLHNMAIYCRVFHNDNVLDHDSASRMFGEEVLKGIPVEDLNRSAIFHVLEELGCSSKPHVHKHLHRIVKEVECSEPEESPLLMRNDDGKLVPIDFSP